MKAASIRWEREKRNIKDLIPADYNPRKMTAEERKGLEDSIKEFGAVIPLVLNIGKRKDVVIGGHQRSTIYADLGIQEVDVMVPSRELSIAEEKKLNLRLNKNTGSWDFLKLKEIDLDLLLNVGFDAGEMTKMLDVDKKLIDDDKVKRAEDIKKPKTKRGDIYQLGDHRLMCGDSTIQEDVKTLMAGKQSDIIFTDPPWNVAIGKDSNPRHRQREGLINDDLGKDFYAFLAGTALNIVKFNKGDVYCVMGCEEWPNIHRALTDSGLHWSSTIVWVKDQFVLGRSKYHRRYEPIWYGWLTKSSYIGDRKQDDVWEIPRPKRSEEHPTMKPVDLVALAIKNSSKIGGLVLDLFGGSGSTLMACEQLGRVNYSMELDPRYCDVIVDRWENFTKKKAKKL